jgi:hypothetical protein
LNIAKVPSLMDPSSAGGAVADGAMSLGMAAGTAAADIPAMADTRGTVDIQGTVDTQAAILVVRAMQVPIES